MSKARDWTGFTVVIPDQHSLVITGLWNKEKADIWWWKCGDCTHSSGTINTSELERLEGKGMIVPPKEHMKLPSEYSSHPKEGEIDYEMMYGCYW